MTKLRMLALACGVTLAVAPLAPAQDKTPPIKNKELKQESFDDLLKSYQQGAAYATYRSGDEVLNHGDFVTVNVKGEGKVTGVFIWADPKTGRLYIRTRAGLPPISVPGRDADKIERITPASGTSGKGGVRPAIELDERPAKAGQGAPEIHTMTIRNGPVTSTFFFDSSLSAAERDQLGTIEKAGSDLAQKSNTVDSLRQALQNAASDNGTTVVQSGGYGPSGVPYYYPLAAYYPYNFHNYAWNAGPFDAGYFGAGYAGAGFAGAYGATGGSTVVVQNSGSSGQSLAAVAKSLSEAQTALNEAQKTYVAVSQRAIYDPSGRIVAVRLED